MLRLECHSIWPNGTICQKKKQRISPGTLFEGDFFPNPTKRLPKCGAGPGYQNLVCGPGTSFRQDTLYNKPRKVVTCTVGMVPKRWMQSSINGTARKPNGMIKASRAGMFCWFLRKIQQIPGTDPRYPKIQIWQDILHQQVVEGLGYVPGVCWSFLRWLDGLTFISIIYTTHQTK